MTPTSFLLTSVYKMNSLIKSECLKIGASVNHFFSSFHASSISNVQQFSNLIEIILLSSLTICPNPWIYFLKKPTALRNSLSLEIVVDHSKVSIATTLPGSGIVSNAEIQCSNNFISDLTNSYFSTFIFNSAYFS